MAIFAPDERLPSSATLILPPLSWCHFLEFVFRDFPQSPTEWV